MVVFVALVMQVSTTNHHIILKSNHPGHQRRQAHTPRAVQKHFESFGRQTAYLYQLPKSSNFEELRPLLRPAHPTGTKPLSNTIRHKKLLYEYTRSKNPYVRSDNLSRRPTSLAR